MNTLNGYSKSTLTDMYALTAAGGHYPLLPSGYAYSSTAGLSHYWCRMLTCPIKHNNNDYDITLYVHSAYNNKRGFVHVRAKLSTTLYVNLTQISGNLPLTAFRLYYNVDENNSAEIQLWCNCGVRWDVYNYKIISFTTRSSNETSFPGDLYSGYFSETQTLPDWEYITLTQLYTPIMKEGKSYSWYNFQQYDANDQIPSYYISDCAVINITSYQGWQPWIRAVDSNKGSWALGMLDTSVYLGYINKTNTSNDLTASWSFNSSGSTTLPGSVLPASTNSQNLGSEFRKWNYLYATNVNAAYVNATNLNGALPDTSLTWKTRSNDLNCSNPSLISVASMSMLSANRLQFARPAGITIEYSTDGGTTWEDYGCTDNEKINLVSGHSNIIKAGKGLSAKATANDKLRITIHATNAGIYTRARALLINASTNGSLVQGKDRILVDMETAPRSSEGNFTVSHTGLIISGWTGWNQIPLNGVSFGGGTTQTSNTGAIRLTFYSDGAGSSQTSGAHFDVRDLYLIGDTFWNIPSKMAKTGHLYDYDYLQDMILPKDLIPETHNGGQIGWRNRQWSVVCANYFYENGTLLSDKYLGKTAQAASSVISTKTGDGTNILYSEKNNEINFGGTNNSDTIYFGYRATDSKPIPSKFVFGSSTGSAELVAKKFTGDLNGNAANSTIAKTLPHFKISSNSTLPSDGSPEYVKFATITIPTTAWSRKSATLFFQDYESPGYQGDILTIQATSNSSGVGIIPSVKWVTKYQKSTIGNIIISKVSDNVYDLYLEATTLSYVTLRVFYLTTDDVGTDKTFNFINNASAWSTTVPVITSRSTLKNVASELGSAKTLWGQSFDGTTNVSGNMAGVGSISMSDALTLSGTTSSSALITFSRTGANTWNYINWPGNSATSCLLAFGYGNSSDKSYYYMSSAALYPASNNTKTLGTSDNKWSNVYATTFTGNVTGNVSGSSGSCTGTSEYAKALVVTSAIGDFNTPVYINASGVPVACSYDVDSVKTSASNIDIFYIAGSSSNSTTTGTLYKSANVKVQSGTAVYASGGFYESSDARLKNFGNDINIDLDKLVKIPKKYFTWKDDKNVTLQIGTSAQAVKELYPELVREDENGVLSVAYDKLAIIALAAVDKLYELVKSLQANGKGN